MVEFMTFAQQVLRRHQTLLEAFLERHADDLDALAHRCAEVLSRKTGKLLIFGNGGSAADAQHLAAEFVNRFDRERIALPALALTTDASILTSIANDSDFRFVFSRQVEALGAAGDIVLGISTSGRSENVRLGLKAGRSIGAFTAALLGNDGGPCAGAADIPMVVPGNETARIQEVHLVAEHLLCRRVEDLIGADQG